MIIRSERLWLRLAVVLLYGFLLAPIAIVVLAALNSGAYLRFPPEGFSLRWFAAFARSRSFTQSLAFSLELATIVTLIATGLGTMASLWLSRSTGAGRDLLRVLVVSPLAVPGILTGIALLIFFYALGWTKTGLGGLVIGHTLLTLPYVFLITSAVLARFDQTLEEAARNLGASPARTFWRVTLPLIKPIMLVVVLFSMIATFADFQLIYVLTRGGPYSSTHVFGTYAYEIAMRAAKLGQGASISLFLFPFLLAVIVFQLWYIRRGD